MRSLSLSLSLSLPLSLSSEEGSGFVRDGVGERHGGPGTFRHIDFSVLAPVITHRVQRRDSNGFLPYFFFKTSFLYVVYST